MVQKLSGYSVCNFKHFCYFVIILICTVRFMRHILFNVSSRLPCECSYSLACDVN